jgi:gamma-glutamyltranspeptidase/glutathione hydrolase
MKHLLSITLAASVVLVSSAAPRQQPSAAAVGTTAMVSSAHKLATEAGLEILDAGGNAFDAAVAIAAALNVVEPAMSGMGGYGTILLYDAKSKKTWFLNPSGRIPKAVDSDAFRAPTRNYMENRVGAKSVSMPGNVNAWEAMSKRYGALPWKRLFEPAIRYASEGFALQPVEASVMARMTERMAAPARDMFRPNGKPLEAGQRFVQADLARSLRLVADQGATVFYTGEIGMAIDRAMKDAGGYLSLDDLRADTAEWREPIALNYRGVNVVTASPPANAFDYLVRLGVMEQFDTKALGHNSVEYLHRFAEVTKHGFWVRLRHAGDPDVAPPPIDRLLSPAYFREQAKAIDVNKARPFVPPGGASGADGHTTHFVVADRHGNVVSATQTLGGAFGSHIRPKGTGIWLNNSLSYSTFEPKGNPMDAHAGRRKLSGDCPTILFRNGRPWAALGTPGGHTIGQTVPQIVMNLIDFGMDVHRALEAPRVSFAEPDELVVEDRIADEVRRGLEARGHKLRVSRGIGNAHALVIEYGSAGTITRFTGAADPRGYAGLAAGR